MPWEVKVGGKAMLVDDLPVGVLDDIAAAHDGVDSWFDLVAAPLRVARAAVAVLHRVAERLEVEVPESLRDANSATWKPLLEHFELVTDDLPAMFEEGGIPKGEKDAAETQTSSSSSELSE